MSDSPLKSVENKADSMANAIGNNSNFGKENLFFFCNLLKFFLFLLFHRKIVNYQKSRFLAKSPIKLSMTEKHVIGGLKQLTELLFKQHYKHNITDENNEPLQSDEVTTSTEYEATSIDNQTDKENNDRIQQFLDNAMGDGHGEQFCAMVIEQLTSGHSTHHSEEWHRGQLEAYNMAHKRLFEQQE